MTSIFGTFLSHWAGQNAIHFLNTEKIFQKVRRERFLLQKKTVFMLLACSFFAPFFACVAPPAPRTFSVSLGREPLDPGRDFVSLRFPPPTFVSPRAEFAHSLSLRFAAREVHSLGPEKRKIS